MAAGVGGRRPLSRPADGGSGLSPGSGEPLGGAAAAQCLRPARFYLRPDLVFWRSQRPFPIYLAAWVVIVDPFVSCHRVNENDNSAIERVAKSWARVAEETNCSVMAAHHNRKTGSEGATVDDGRGASALRDAARTARDQHYDGARPKTRR